jgi:Xaa-Pro aminopeptidase
MNNTSISSLYKTRLATFRKHISEKGIEAALIQKRESYMYLSGFTGSSAYLLISDRDALLITDFRYTEQALKQAALFNVIEYQGSIYNKLSMQLKESGIETLAFEESYVTYDKYDQMKEKLELKELIPLGGIIEIMRMKKDEYELAHIKKAVEIADKAYDHILPFIKPGVEEIDIAAEMEYFMKKQGASGASFETIVASGYRSSMPHGVASEKKLEMGEAVTLDFGAIYAGYCSDITRTVFIGNPGEELIKIYEIVLRAQLKSIEGARRGIIGKDIDAIARDIIAQAGYGNNFGHGLGHGVGLEIHEEPRFSPSGLVTMENGMVITDEPGIYVSGLGGVRIEDIIVINDDNPVILTGAPKAMTIL